MVINECRRIGYSGVVWAVNRQRAQLGGINCFNDVAQLPEAPDAVFLAVPADAAVEVVKQLASIGAGGVVCYTAGFGDDGKEGGAAERALLEAVGDMVLVGPNCYGLINYIDQVALWPFAHGGYAPGFGAAIITQSGMLSSDITMNQRSLPLAYMISAGNQSMLRLEDYVDVLCDCDAVRAFGLHIEGLKDVQAFSRVAKKSLQCGKPMVVLKTGISSMGKKLTLSHTGSLSGDNELYTALFERLGIIQVETPAELIETLKFLTISAMPKGRRLMGFTCSGGGATLLADYAEKIGLELPQPSEITSTLLAQRLPKIATVSNPLDYTTPIWGVTANTQPVFEAALRDGYDAAVIVQDYPAAGLDESKQYYLNDATALINAARLANIPAAVMSTLPENIDQTSREYFIAHAVTPLQGIAEGVNALSAAAWCYQKMQQLDAAIDDDLYAPIAVAEVVLADEYSSKQLLQANGLNIPEARLANFNNVADIAEQIGLPVALKFNSSEIAHKTEAGAVLVALNSRDSVSAAAAQIGNSVTRYAVDNALAALTSLDNNRRCLLVEKMAPAPIAELMIDIRCDHQFGLAMTLAAGGVLVEILKDAITLLLPTTAADILHAIFQLEIAPMLNGFSGEGFRGAPAVDKAMLAQVILRIAGVVATHKQQIAELEINPLFVYQDHCVVIDVLLYRHRNRL